MDKREKKSFVMYRSWAAYITALPDLQAAHLIKAICAFETGEEFQIEDPMLQIYFESVVLPELKKNDEKYETKVKTAIEIARRRRELNEVERNRTMSNDVDRSRTMPNDIGDVSVSDSVSDSVSVSVSESVSVSDSVYKDIKDIGKRKRFQRPTVAEVSEYCDERHNNVDPQRFVDYYDSNGWHVGKNPMKDWKAAVRTWERNSTGDRKPQEQSGREWLMQEVERNECRRG